MIGCLWVTGVRSSADPRTSMTAAAMIIIAHGEMRGRAPADASRAPASGRCPADAGWLGGMDVPGWMADRRAVHPRTGKMSDLGNRLPHTPIFTLHDTQEPHPPMSSCPIPVLSAVTGSPDASPPAVTDGETSRLAARLVGSPGSRSPRGIRYPLAGLLDGRGVCRAGRRVVVHRDRGLAVRPRRGHPCPTRVRPGRSGHDHDVAAADPPRRRPSRDDPPARAGRMARVEPVAYRARRGRTTELSRRSAGVRAGSDRGYAEPDWRGAGDPRYRDDDFRTPEQRAGADEGRYADPATPRYGDPGRFGATDPLGDGHPEEPRVTGRPGRAARRTRTVSGELPGERGGRRAARESAIRSPPVSGRARRADPLAVDRISDAPRPAPSAAIRSSSRPSPAARGRRSWWGSARAARATPVRPRSSSADRSGRSGRDPEPGGAGPASAGDADRSDAARSGPGSTPGRPGGDRRRPPTASTGPAGRRWRCSSPCWCWSSRSRRCGCCCTA